MTEKLLGAWYPFLKEEINQEYFQVLRESLRKEYSDHLCCPQPSNIFRAFELTDPATIKVIIIGQDPYPSTHADGLAFSTQQGSTPFSLQRILREVDRDVVKTSTLREFKLAFPTNSLEAWARQGVFLINPILTVRSGDIGSHSNLGWQKFTAKALDHLAVDSAFKVIMSWGGEARKVVEALAINPEVGRNHVVLDTGHPASGAHGKDQFSGCNHFSKANRYLSKHNIKPINWTTA